MDADEAVGLTRRSAILLTGAAAAYPATRPYQSYVETRRMTFSPNFADLVRNYTTTSGTDDFVLSAAVNGFASFTDACKVGDNFYYSAIGVDNPADTEIGRGTLLDGGIISRDPISGTKTNFQSGTKSVALVAAAEWLSQVDAARSSGGATNVKSFGCKGDGAADDTAAIQEALDHLGSIGGGALYFPEGTYIVSSFLTVHPKTVIRGAGRASTVIQSSHSGGVGASAAESLRNGSVLVTSAPINGSTAIYFVLEDIAIANSNAANAGAAYYDTGGTFIACRNVGFGGFKYGVVLDQSELADFDLCEFAGQNAGGAGVWIVNGGDLNAAAAMGYCNRISIKRSQFNQSLSAYGILDDGGYNHVFEDNNYNGCLNAIRAAGVFPLSIRGGEFEGSAEHCLLLSSQSLSGASVGSPYTHVFDCELAPSPGHSGICGVGGGAGQLTIDGMTFFAGASHGISGASSFAAIYALSYTSAANLAAMDGPAAFVSVDLANPQTGPTIEGVTLNNGVVTASNIGSAAAHAEGDFLAAPKSLADRIALAKAQGSGVVVAQSAVAVPHTGDTAEFTFATIPIPANSMGANGRIAIKARFSGTGSGNAKTPRIRFGGTTIMGNLFTAATFARYDGEVSNRNSANSQEGFVWLITSTGATAANLTAVAADTTQDQAVTLTGQLAASGETITLESYQICLYPKD